MDPLTGLADTGELMAVERFLDAKARAADPPGTCPSSPAPSGGTSTARRSGSGAAASRCTSGSPSGRDRPSTPGRTCSGPSSARNAWRPGSPSQSGSMPSRSWPTSTGSWPSSRTSGPGWHWPNSVPGRSPSPAPSTGEGTRSCCRRSAARTPSCSSTSTTSVNSTLPWTRIGRLATMRCGESAGSSRASTPTPWSFAGEGTNSSCSSPGGVRPWRTGCSSCCRPNRTSACVPVTSR